MRTARRDVIGGVGFESVPSSPSPSLSPFSPLSDFGPHSTIYTFLGNFPPTPSLSHHFVLTEK